MANDGMKDIVSSSVTRAIETEFSSQAWSTQSLNAEVNMITPNECVVAVRAVNIIAGQSEVDRRFFRVRVTEVK